MERVTEGICSDLSVGVGAESSVGTVGCFS